MRSTVYSNFFFELNRVQVHSLSEGPSRDHGVCMICQLTHFYSSENQINWWFYYNLNFHFCWELARKHPSQCWSRCFIHPAKTRVICMACHDYDATYPTVFVPNLSSKQIVSTDNMWAKLCDVYMSLVFKGFIMSWRKGYKSLSLSCRDCIAKAEFTLFNAQLNFECPSNIYYSVALHQCIYP